MPLKIQNYEIHTDLIHDEVRIRFISGQSALSFPAHKVIIWCHLGSLAATSYATFTVTVDEEQERYDDRMFFKIDLNKEEMKQVMDACPFLYVTYSADQENPYETPNNYFLRKLIDPETIKQFAKTLDKWDCFYIMGKRYGPGHFDTWYASIDQSLDVLPEGNPHDLHYVFASHAVREQIQKNIQIN